MVCSSYSYYSLSPILLRGGTLPLNALRQVSAKVDDLSAVALQAEDPVATAGMVGKEDHEEADS